MKRKYLTVFAALLCSIAVVLCGCGAESGEDSSDVTYFNGETTTKITKEAIGADVTAGKLQMQYADVSETDITTDVKLGMKSDALLAALDKTDVDRQEGEAYIRYDCGSAYFYYTNDSRANGLAAIVYFGTAYGFEPGVTTVDEIEKVMGEQESTPASDDAVSMFLHFAPNVTFNDYHFGDNAISFYFDGDGILTATVIYQNGLWI